ncbi:hypothetical protein CK203_066944 [Vitis vinifera]|uniref:Uncharacterized protein n=1 Tax=Vitis vinifera TaxID=29760 RepID=A0A438F591_VITVI|nr:hypothetical protein CK203_066944 [Vitis vinifera]
MSDSHRGEERGVSTWVRLGLESLGLFKEGLIHCIRDEKEGRWEKEWRERGKRFTLARGFNRAGGFLRLGLWIWNEKFSASLTRGRRNKRGWTAMAEMIRQMEELAGRRMELQEVRANRKNYSGEIIRRSSHEYKSKRHNCNQDEGLEGGDGWKLTEIGTLSRRELEVQQKEEKDLERLGSLWRVLGT